MTLFHVKNSGRFTSIKGEDGREVAGVAEADIKLRPSEIPILTMQIASQLDLTAEPRFVVVDPRDGTFRQVKRIEFADGTMDWKAP